MNDENCDQQSNRNNDLTECMKEFYDYQGDFCRSVDYLSRNASIKLEAFTTGKSCFMDFVEIHCSKDVVAYLDSSYGEFLNALTVPPTENRTCVSLYDQLITAECSVYQTRLFEEIEALNNTKTLRATCKELEECLNQSSYISAGNDLDDYKKRCRDEVSLSSGVNFTGCLIKFGYLSLTKYDCIPPNAKYPEFFGFEVHPNFFEDKECARTFMFRECEGIVDAEDFEENWSILIKNRKNMTVKIR